MRYQILEHTADQAIRAYGADLRELIENAAAGLLALLYVEAPPAPAQELDLPVAAESPEFVLHHALRELLYLLEDEALAPVQVAVSSANEHQAVLHVGVIPREQAELLFAAPVKAVTRHGLSIEKTPDGLMTIIVFDV